MSKRSMNKQQFSKRLNKIQSTIAAHPAKAEAEIDALLKVKIPIGETAFFFKSLALTKAQIRFQTQQYEACIRETSDYIKWETEANEDWRLAHLLRGKAYLFEGHPENCLSDLRTATDTKGSDKDKEFLVDCYTHRGKALYQLKRFDEAISAFQEVKRLAPEDTSNLSALAEVYRATGNYREAINILSEAARLEGENPQILSDLGSAYFENTDYEIAEAVFTTAINLKPDDPSLYEHRAVTRKQLGKKNASEDWMIAQFLTRDTPEQ